MDTQVDENSVSSVAEQIPNYIDPEFAIANGLCPITGEKVDIGNTIILSKWLILGIAAEHKRKEVSVSAEGKKIYKNNHSTLWEVFDTVGRYCMYIPWLGIILLLYLMFFCLIGIPIFYFVDKKQGRKPLARGPIYLAYDGKIRRRESK